jgi:hypothetical protein
VSSAIKKITTLETARLSVRLDHIARLIEWVIRNLSGTDVATGAVGGVFCDATNQELSKSSCTKPRYRQGKSMDCK